MKSKNEIIEILKSFEQVDYRCGGKTIPPEMYSAIANKIWEKKPEKFDCMKCRYSFMNPFDQYFCTKMKQGSTDTYDIDNEEDCNGEFFVRMKKNEY